MSESKKVWARVKKHMPGRWQRIENRADVGTPDTAYVMPSGATGWVEFKHLKKGWPARAETQTSIGLEPAQVIFLNDWVKAGGRAYLLARIEGPGGCWLIVPGDRVVAKDTKAGWLHRAAWSGDQVNWLAMSRVLGHTGQEESKVIGNVAEAERVPIGGPLPF